MKCLARMTLVAALVGLAAGCDALLGALEFLNVRPTTITIAFANTSEDFGVEVAFFSSDEQDIPRELLATDDFGNRLAFTVPAGETVSFARRCDEVKAMVIEDADLLVLGGLGPEAQSNVVREDQDYECGDRITFTFSHSAEILDFRVTESVEAPAAVGP